MVARSMPPAQGAEEKGDYVALQQLPRNSSPTRLHSRCAISGRPRGYLRKFGISRIAFRDLALDGKIPGVTQGELVRRDEQPSSRETQEMYHDNDRPRLPTI